MKRLLLAAMVMSATPAIAGVGDTPYYGPAVHWHGIGYKFGYEDRVESDGRWRIEASVRNGSRFDGAIAMAMYRAAEKARDQGSRYVAFLGGKAWRAPGIARATVYARPAASADAPTGCVPARQIRCYVASVAEVLRKFGGPDGSQPGVEVADYHDQYGRAVFTSSYGAGAIGEGGREPMSPARIAPPVPPVALAATPNSVRGAAFDSAAEAQARFDKAQREQRGASHGEGWTASD